jgi:hypothetical protein
LNSTGYATAIAGFPEPKLLPEVTAEFVRAKAQAS